MRFSGANWRHYQQFCEFAAFRFVDRNFNRRSIACFFLIKTFHENPTQWTLATAWAGRPDPPCRGLNGTHVRNILLALFDFSLKRTRCVYASRIRHEVHSVEANFCDCHFLRSNSYVNSVTIFECYHWPLGHSKLNSVIFVEFHTWRTDKSFRFDCVPCLTSRRGSVKRTWYRFLVTWHNESVDTSLGFRDVVSIEGDSLFWIGLSNKWREPYRNAILFVFVVVFSDRKSSIGNYFKRNATSICNTCRPNEFHWIFSPRRRRFVAAFKSFSENHTFLASFFSVKD